MRVSWVFLILTLIVATTLSQDSSESEETATPKKVLRKYRVRRPVQGNENDSGEIVTIKTSPRIRRVRVKQPRPLVIEATPQTLISSRYESTTPLNKLQESLPQSQPQQVFYDEHQVVVDPVRFVPNYRQATPSGTRSALLAKVNLRDPDHEDNKKTVVGTTRNYSHINEDGSFTFGYEAEDGSFKEETRGTDCVVRGKYGYVDPSGVRREFSYVSGNPCDPNDPNKGETLDDTDELDNESIQPARAGIRQRIPVERKPILINSNVQQALEQTVEERVTEDQVFRPLLRRLRPQSQLLTQTQRPNIIEATTFRPRIRITQATPTSQVPEAVIRSFPLFRQPTPLNPRPLAEPSQDLSDRNSRGFNFQEELQDIARPLQLQQSQQQPEEAQAQIQYRQPTPAPQPQQIQYRQQTPAPPAQQIQYRQSTPAPPAQQIQYRQPQQIQYHQGQPHPIHTFPQRQHFGSQANSIFQQQRPQETVVEEKQEQPNYARYRTELIYDQASGQYTNVVVQEHPKSGEEFTLTQRLRAFSDPRENGQLQIQHIGQQQPQIQYYQPQNQFGQQFQQHHLQYSAQSPQTAATNAVHQLHPEAQQITNSASASAASGQIDAFLRTINFAS